MPPLQNLVNGVIEQSGPKKDLILMDNNVTASSRYKEIIAEICDLGFTANATLERGGKRLKRRVDFNQGVDARILAKSSMYLKEMSRICISPLRIAFDHIGLRKVYDIAVRMAADNGINSLSNYMLYNFMDTPDDLYARMKLNIDLNEELGIRIWSFPMRYQPVTLKDRSHIGKHWNRYYLRSFQVILQATHGVVSGNPGFFNHAYGVDVKSFKRLLSYPHAFIFNRNYYEIGEGRAVLEEYQALRNQMSEGQEGELLSYLAAPVGGDKARQMSYRALVGKRSVNRLVREVIAFHVLATKDRKIADTESMFHLVKPDPVLPSEEEFVEDAGLFDNEQGEQDVVSLKNTNIIAKTGT